MDIALIKRYWLDTRKTCIKAHKEVVDFYHIKQKKRMVIPTFDSKEKSSNFLKHPVNRK
jgi:hypothetical protein